MSKFPKLDKNLISLFLKRSIKAFSKFFKEKKFKAKRLLGLIKTNWKSFRLFKKELKENNHKVKIY